MNLSEIVANVKKQFEEFSVLENTAQAAIDARDAARAATAKVLDDAIAGLQKLRDSIGVPKDVDPPKDPEVT